MNSGAVRACPGCGTLACPRGLRPGARPDGRPTYGPIALQDGPDAAQEALITILRGIRGLREPAALFGWARVIAVREAVRIARRAARASAVPVEQISAPGDPQLKVDIADTLARLTPEHRAVLVLRDMEGLDELQAGRILSVLGDRAMRAFAEHPDLRG